MLNIKNIFKSLFYEIGNFIQLNFFRNSGGRSYIVTSLAELLNNNKILKLNKKFFKITT